MNEKMNDCIYYLEPELVRYPGVEVVAGLGDLRPRHLPSGDTLGDSLQGSVPSPDLG